MRQAARRPGRGRDQGRAARRRPGAAAAALRGRRAGPGARALLAGLQREQARLPGRSGDGAGAGAVPAAGRDGRRGRRVVRAGVDGGLGARLPEPGGDQSRPGAGLDQPVRAARSPSGLPRPRHRDVGDERADVDLRRAGRPTRAHQRQRPVLLRRRERRGRRGPAGAAAAASQRAGPARGRVDPGVGDPQQLPDRGEMGHDGAQPAPVGAALADANALDLALPRRLRGLAAGRRAALHHARRGLLRLAARRGRGRRPARPRLGGDGPVPGAAGGLGAGGRRDAGRLREVHQG